MPDYSGSIDANVILRLLLNDVAEQHLAATNLIKNSSAPFAVSDTAVIEVVFVLERNYTFSRPHIVEAIEGMMSLAEIRCNQELIQKALKLFEKHPALSFEDCCLSVYAELGDATPLWTFDRKLANQVGSVKLVG